MSNKELYELMKATFSKCEEIARAKGADYTVGSQDALANFKGVGLDMDIPPQVACWIFMNKHYKAITNYVKSRGKSQSEPIDGRIDDLINYLVLLKGLIKEEEHRKGAINVLGESLESSNLVQTP
jgi:hypothetical protein